MLGLQMLCARRMNLFVQQPRKGGHSCSVPLPEHDRHSSLELLVLSSPSAAHGFLFVCVCVYKALTDDMSGTGKLILLEARHESACTLLGDRDPSFARLRVS